MVAVVAGGVATLFGISTTAATIATSVAFYAATTALSYYIQQSNMPDPEPSGSRLDIEMGGAIGQSILFGDVEKAGHLFYAGSWGRSNKTPNGFLVQCFILADLTDSGDKSTAWIDGQKCTIDLGDNGYTGSDGGTGGYVMGHPVTTLRKSGKDYKWIKFKDGSQTTADDYLLGKFGMLASRPYTSDMIGIGRPLAIVTTRLDKEEGGRMSEHQFVRQGSAFYDPRKDSTNGGSGSHRWGNRSTYEFTRNPAVIYYNVRRGIYYDGDLLYGGRNVSAYMLDNDTYFAAMNTCDENVALAAGGTEKRYAVGGEMDLTRPPADLLDNLLASMNGRVVEDGGVSKLYCGAIGASVYSFTDDDIIATEAEDGSLIPQPDDVFNKITGSYTEPDDGGQAVAYRSKSDADALARDTEMIARSMDFPFVRSNSRAQRCAKYVLKDGQRWRKHGLVLPPPARKLRPCDVVSWTSAEKQYSSKKFLAGDVTPLRDGNVRVKLREANPADSDWTTGDEDASTPGIYDRVYPDAQTFSATVTAVSITDDDNTTARRPGIRIQATLDADDVDCKALVWQVRKRDGDQKLIAHGRSVGFFETDSSVYGDITFTDNAFLPGKRVEVRYKVEPQSDRETDWSAWVDGRVTLTNAKFGGADIGDREIATRNIQINGVTNREGRAKEPIVHDYNVGGTHGAGGSPGTLHGSGSGNNGKSPDTILDFTFENVAGAAITVGFSGTLSSYIDISGSIAAGKAIANARLVITQTIGGVEKTVKTIASNGAKKLGKKKLIGDDPKTFNDFVILGDGTNRDVRLRVYFYWQAQNALGGSGGYKAFVGVSLKNLSVIAFNNKV